MLWLYVNRSRMTVHQAAEHPWIKEEHQELDKRIPASRYNDVRKTIHDKYVSVMSG